MPSGTAIAAPMLFLAALPLIPSGVAKLRDPGSASRALASIRWPHRLASVRVLGAVEIVVGGGALLTGRPPFALAVSALYLTFAVFLTTLIRSGAPLGSCGCLGAREAPPRLIHVALDVVGAAAGLAGVWQPVSGLFPFASDTPLLGLPLLAGLAACAYLAFAAVAYLPDAFASYRGAGGRGP